MRRLITLTRPSPKPGRASKAAKRQRRRLHINWRTAHWQFGALGLVILATLAGPFWLWQSGWVSRQIDSATTAVFEATADAGLRVDDVLVEGRQRSAPSDILKSLGVSRGTPILTFDPHAAKQRLETLPWVYKAIVERRLPQIVYVRLVERQPLALWQRNGTLALIDQVGKVVPNVALGSFSNLPLVVGDDAPQNTTELLAMLASEPDLNAQVSAAIRVGGRRWNIRLDNGIDVRLPETNPAAAWAQLARVERENGVLERDVIVIDMRQPDRLVVRMAPGAVPGKRRNAKGEET